MNMNSYTTTSAMSCTINIQHSIQYKICKYDFSRSDIVSHTVKMENIFFNLSTKSNYGFFSRKKILLSDPLLSICVYYIIHKAILAVKYCNLRFVALIFLIHKIHWLTPKLQYNCDSHRE